jgi:hypothetical protein
MYIFGNLCFLRFLCFSIILWYLLYSNLSIFILCFSGDYFKNSDYDVFLSVPSNLYFQSDRQNNCNIMLNYHSYMYNIITFSYFKCSWPFLKLKEIWVDERSMSFILISNRTHLTSFHIRQPSDYNR